MISKVEVRGSIPLTGAMKKYKVKFTDYANIWLEQEAKRQGLSVEQYIADKIVYELFCNICGHTEMHISTVGSKIDGM